MTEHVGEPDESRTAYEGKLLDVTVELWGDHEREIVEHPGAVAIVAVDGDRYVTLVRQLREPARRRLLELPAGTREVGEEPLATADVARVLARLPQQRVDVFQQRHRAGRALAQHLAIVDERACRDVSRRVERQDQHRLQS